METLFSSSNQQVSACTTWTGHVCSIYSLAQSHFFYLLGLQFWSSFSKGPKRLTFYFLVFWASESMNNPFIGNSKLHSIRYRGTASRRQLAANDGIGRNERRRPGL